MFALRDWGRAASAGMASSVDSLAMLEGGAEPLDAAIDRMLDLAVADQFDIISLLVVTEGVPIITIGLTGASGTADHETLALLAQAGRADAAAFRASDPRQLGPSILAATRFQQGRLEACPWERDYIYDVPFAVQIP